MHISGFSGARATFVLTKVALRDRSCTIGRLRPYIVAIIDNSLSRVVSFREILRSLVSPSFAQLLIISRRIESLFFSFLLISAPARKLITPLEVTTDDTEATTTYSMYRYCPVVQMRKHTRIEGKTRVSRERERQRDKERRRKRGRFIDHYQRNSITRARYRKPKNFSCPHLARALVRVIPPRLRIVTTWNFSFAATINNNSPHVGYK